MKPSRSMFFRLVVFAIVPTSGFNLIWCSVASNWVQRFLRPGAILGGSNEYGEMVDAAERGQVGIVQEAFGDIENATRSTDITLRSRAAAIIFETGRMPRYGDVLESHLPVLFRLLDDSDIGVQRSLLITLDNLAPKCKALAVPRVLEYLRGPRSLAKGAAVFYLGRVARTDEAVWTAVEGIFTDENTTLAEKRSIVQSLVFPRMSLRAAGIAVRALDTPELREESINALGRMGDLAISFAFAKLSTLESDASQPEGIRIAAKNTMNKLGK